MRREVVMLHLRQAFGGTPGERRAVARAADDLAASGRYHEDGGVELTPQFVVEQLADAPDEAEGPAARWNWWIGSLELAYGGYEQFTVRNWETEEAEPGDGDPSHGR